MVDTGEFKEMTKLQQSQQQQQQQHDAIMSTPPLPPSIVCPNKIRQQPQQQQTALLPLSLPLPLPSSSSSISTSSASSSSCCTSTSTGNKVKLCGYLKKKRNKVGGWRKLWFVLQDKLLLSYSSKEEYDNKLVSFKDVLNLVPGTMVRPLGGFRFTIETTSQTMYTFHCDDRIAYREWMTTLLDSLSTQPTIVQQKFAHHHNRLINSYTSVSSSVDSIPHALLGLTKCNAPLNRRSVITSSSSYDSISHVERATALPPTTTTATTTPPLGCVRMPIVQNTAKLLERNGINSSRELQMFRNRKFILANHYNANDNKTNSADAGPDTGAYDSERCFANYRLGAFESSAEMRLYQSQLSKRPHTASASQGGKAQGARDQHTENHAAVSYFNTNSGETERKAYDLVKEHIHRLSIKGTKEYATTSVTTAAGAATTIPASKVPNMINQNQRATATTAGTAATTATSATSATTTNIERDIYVMPTSTCNYSSSSLAAENNNNKACRSCLLEQATRMSDTATQKPLGASTEPVYAVVDLQNKYAQRRLRGKSPAQLPRCNSYDSIVQYSRIGGIDASNQRVQTNKRASLAEDDIDGIYEDGDKLFGSTAVTAIPKVCHGSNGSAVIDKTSKQKEPHQQHRQHQQQPQPQPQLFNESESEENIYEPINIAAEYAQQTGNRAFWKYFTSRLKVKPLLQLTTRLGTKQQGSKRSACGAAVGVSLIDYDGIKQLSTTAAAAAAAAATTSANTKNLSHFASIKHKFGTQRKSLRARMRKFCVRAYEPKPFCSVTAAADTDAATSSSNATTTTSSCPLPDVGMQKKLRNRWRTVKLRPRNAIGVMSSDETTTSSRPMTRRFFGGSLPHLRKTTTRITIFSAQKQQQQQQVKLPNENPASSKPKSKSHSESDKPIKVAQLEQKTIDKKTQETS